MSDPSPSPVEGTSPRDVRKFLEPKPRYRRVVDRLECPMCGKTLGQRLPDHNQPTGWNVAAYTDTQQTYPPSPLAVRTFHPCGCEDIALIEARRG